MVVVAGPVPAGTYKKPVNSLRHSAPKGAGLARELRLVSGCGVLTTQPCSLPDCTDPSASVADILTAVADRFSLEITFRDCKEVVGAGQQQVRFVWANIGAFHVCLWTFTMTEAWAWTQPADELVDRSASPWDSPLRRPSHADKRRAWRRALLGEEIRAALRPGVTEAEIQATAERLRSLAA